MAIYHCSIKIISRGKGKSAVAAAAYRAGETITNEYDGITHDYTRKGGVVYTEILLPEHAPKEYADRSTLWNAVEQIEKNKNSQLAREIELALPLELSREQNISLTREYVKRHFVSAGMCADVCIHDKNDGNPHVHIMLTMRPIEQNGSWGAKAHKINGQKISMMDWNDQSKAEEWRAGWADAVNTYLKGQCMDELVDHRSYERQGIKKIPAVHMGVAAAQMERRGIVTDRGDRNREIAVTNRQLRQLGARISQLKDWLKVAVLPAAPQTLEVSIQGILEGNELQGRYGHSRDLESAERVLNFLQENGISTLPELREKVSEIQNCFDDVRGNIQLTEMRIKALDELIRQAGIYSEHRELYTQYQKLRPRKQPKFFEAHRAELMLFEAANRYFDVHLNGHELPLKAWEQERAELTVKRGKAYREYGSLREQVFEVETIRRAAERIAREIGQPEPQKHSESKAYER
jgi:hypothetical protein